MLKSTRGGKTSYVLGKKKSVPPVRSGLMENRNRPAGDFSARIFARGSGKRPTAPWKSGGSMMPRKVFSLPAKFGSTEKFLYICAKY